MNSKGKSGFSWPLIILAVLVFGVGFVLFIKFLNKPFSKQAWMKYKNGRYGFTVEYRPGWTLGAQETNNAGREIQSPDGDILCYVYGFENALITEDGDPQTLEEFVEWISGESNVVEKTSAVMAGKEGTRIVTEEDSGQIRNSIYILLDDDTGRGLWCAYEDTEAMDAHAEDFKRMQESMDLSDSDDISFDNMHTACATYLNNSIEPLKDLKNFIDDKYTGVTLTERASWDKDLLPKDVVDLEEMGYTCYPMPYEMEPQKNVPGMHIAPEVTSVEWTCELAYDEFEYLDKDADDRRATLASQGFSCEKKYCQDDVGNDSYVWFCAR